MAGNTTIPSYQGEEDETDSFVSAYSVAEDKVMDTETSSAPPAGIRTPRRAGRTIIDLSGMKKAAAKGDSDVEVEDLSLGLDQKQAGL